MRFLASQAATALGGTLDGPDVALSGASFDSRSLVPGQLFVPLVAERDGHEYIPAALAAGAPAYLTTKAPLGGTAIVVDDTAAALLRLGAWARDQLAPSLTGRVVGITGSVGKTTTKDLLAAALEARWRTTASPRSFNNDQGLPVTLLDAPDDTEALVLEMGMRGFGQIARLCSIGRPHIGIITLIAEAHSELVGGIDGVERAKGELVEALPADGVAVLNGDDHRARRLATRTVAAVLTFGTGADVDVRIEHLRIDRIARARFTARTPWGSVDVRLGVPGRHLAANAAAALAVAGVLDVPLEAAAHALGGAPMSAMRMEMMHLLTGTVVLNDAYNANPTSMVAALRTLAELPARRRVAVLGVMAELEDAPEGHRRVAAIARELGVEVIPVGTDLYGVEPVDDPVAALGALADDHAVLVKGSRVARLEQVIERLRSHHGA